MNLEDRPIEEKKITPGKWHVVEYAGYHIIKDSPFYEGNDILDIDKFPEEQVKANARLIEQSPKLLEIAEMYFDSMKHNTSKESTNYKVTLETLKKVYGYE